MDCFQSGSRGAIKKPYLKASLVRDMQIRTIATSSSLFLLLYGVIGQSAHSGEYYKCVDAKGQISISNVACPSQSNKLKSHQLRDLSEQEYQEARGREEAAKQMEKARQEANAKQEQARELVRAREQCLIEANKRYQTRWDETCLFGGGGCLLNSQIANDYDRSRTEERNECYQRYPQP